MEARRRRYSLLATHLLDQRVSSRGTSCSSGCPPATTVQEDTRDTSRLRNSPSTGPPSSSSTPCAPADCCTCPDCISDTCTSPPHAHTRSCSNSMPARHSRPPTSRSPGSSHKHSPPSRSKRHLLGNSHTNCRRSTAQPHIRSSLQLKLTRLVKTTLQDMIHKRSRLSRSNTSRRYTSCTRWSRLSRTTRRHR
jgi:hypothetical protein